MQENMCILYWYGVASVPAAIVLNYYLVIILLSCFMLMWQTASTTQAYNMAYMHYCGYKCTSVNLKTLLNLFTNASSTIIRFMFCTKLDTNSIVASAC